MKKGSFKLKLMTILLSVVMILGCSGTAFAAKRTKVTHQYPTSIRIEGDREIGYNRSVRLRAEVRPSDAKDKTVKWEVLKGNGRVDEKGLVTCTGAGDIKVQATTVNGRKATFTLKGPKNPSRVVISGDTEIELNRKVRLEAEVYPDDAVDKTVTWSLVKGNGSVDSETGVVTCTGAGDIKVRATTSNGKKATYTLRGPKAPSRVKITGENEIELNKKVRLEAEVYPEDAIDATVTWDVVKGNGVVDAATGVVTCTGSGDIKVRATTTNGKKATFTIKGPKLPSSVKITGDREIKLGKTVKLKATVSPETAIEKEVTWRVDKGNGTVDEKGVVTCTGSGDIKVVATTANGKKGTFTIRGPKDATSVTVKKSSCKLGVGDTIKLEATVNPKGVIDKNVTWSSADESIATVSADGTVTAVGIGKTYIYAAAHNGKTGKCTVTVK